MMVDEVKDFSSFLALEKEWNSLVERSQDDTIFLRHEWFKCWWNAYGAEKELLILLVKEDGELIGISPFMISKVRFRGFPIKKISFIENGLMEAREDEKKRLAKALGVRIQDIWNTNNLGNRNELQTAQANQI